MSVPFSPELCPRCGGPLGMWGSVKLCDTCLKRHIATMDVLITKEIRDAIAHAVRDMDLNGISWTNGYIELKAVWDRISNGEIRVSER